MTDEQEAANQLVREDLNQAFGIPEGSIVTNDDLNGTGDLVAVRWEVALDTDTQGMLNLPFRSEVPITVTGVSLVDIPNETFERHIDWLDALHQLGFMVDTRATGAPQQSTQPISPSAAMQ